MTRSIIIAFLPHVFLTMSVAVILGLQLFDYLKHKRTLEMMVSSFEKNPEIDPMFISSLIKRREIPYADLRKGTVFIGISAAILLFSMGLSSGETRNAIRGLAAFPGLLGLVYIAFQFLPKRNGRD